MGCLRDVLEEAGEHELSAALPWIGTSSESVSSGTHSIDPERLAQAYSIAFHLLSMVEQNAAVQQQRLTEAERGLTAMQALWGQCLQQLVDRGLTTSQIAEALPRMSVELVLTAHPTEAKRTIVLEHHRALYLLLVKRENRMWSPYEQAAIRDEIRSVLSLLWRTGEILMQKPDIAAERRNILHYLTNVFPDVLPVLDRRLRQTWAHLGFDGAVLQSPASLPRFSLSTWVGGDRDGHPLVTAAVTRETLDDLRLHGLLRLRRQLTALARQTSLSDRFQPPPASLGERVRQSADRMSAGVEQSVEATGEDTWPRFVGMMIARLPLDGVYPDGGRLAGEAWRYTSTAELLDDLQVLHDALVSSGAWRVAEDAVAPVIRSVQAFGFHLASLDIRENSRVHDLAVTQLATAAGVDVSGFGSWDEPRRLEFLNRELASPRPFLRSDVSAGPEADRVLATYRVLVEHLHNYGVDGLGALIVSMTRNVSDLLTVYLLAREAGLAINDANGLVCW